MGKTERVVVTGGAGYIGSHTVLQLLEAGYQVFIIDNYSNASPIINSRLMNYAVRYYGIEKDMLQFDAIDIRNTSYLTDVMHYIAPDACIHFAASKSVEDGEIDPFRYYDNNVAGTISLLQALTKVNCHNIIFSSTASIYDSRISAPYYEDNDKGEQSSVYGRSKFMAEHIVKGWAKSTNSKATILRYFNVIGAHPPGMFGEDPKQKAMNLLPVIAEVASGKREKLQVFGDDYPTRDGTCIRDYIHVVDLARAHALALDYDHPDKDNVEIFNLGTNFGLSVLEMITAFSTITGIDIPYEIVDKRPGDVPVSIANCDKAKHLLGWQPDFDVNDAIKHLQNWLTKNPDGYDTPL